MFERYTERARRTVFFARYEASQYGSPYIETEHFLLGLLREDPQVTKLLPRAITMQEIRSEVEKRIDIRECISTSIEVPLSAQCKRALNLAAEEANRLGHDRIGTEHLLLGLLRISDGLAAQILRVDAVNLQHLREKIHVNRPQESAARGPLKSYSSPQLDEAVEALLAALRDGNRDNLEEAFAPDCCFVDASGKLWRSQKEIVANFELLLAPFAKRGAKYLSETRTACNEAVWVATLIWEDVHLPGFSPLDLFRMSIVLVNEEMVPLVYLVQITPIGREAVGKTAAP